MSFYQHLLRKSAMVSFLIGDSKSDSGLRKMAIQM